MVIRQGSNVPLIARHGPSHRSLWWIIAGGFLAVLAGALWLIAPGARLVPSARGIARIRLRGWGTVVRKAAFFSGDHEIPLTGLGRLNPVERIASGESGLIQLTVVGPGLLQWMPWEEQVISFPVSTPGIPHLAQSTIARPLGPGLAVRFSEPVARVQYQMAPHGPVHVESPRTPSRTVVLPLPTALPSQHGTLLVSAAARDWQPFGPSSQVSWSSVPYVTVARAAHRILSPVSSLTVKFSQPVQHPHLSAWRVLPVVAGHWHEISPTEFAFTPTGPTGYGPGAAVEAIIPGGHAGPEAQTGSVMASAATLKWTTPPGSVLRLQEMLAEEGYLPVAWTATAPVSQPTLNYEDSAIYQPPQGQFTWKYSHLPSQLKALWTPGQMSVMTKGAIMQFERANGLPVDGIAGPMVWKTLIRDRLAGKTSPWPYSYISVTESFPETLELWVGNTMVLSTPANTGIPVTPTYLGTFPIYERLPFQVMRGKNPNGVPYADPVYWINYFNGGDAVHGFVRASYGFPQSLGCVEVPPSVSQTIYRQVHYGTLVTVNPVGVPPAPAS